MSTNFPTGLSDAELCSEVERLARSEREATARLVAHLAEFDARRLYLPAGYSSLFAYCCQALGLSEHETYNRIEAARAARKFPVILEMLSTAALNLTAVRLLAPHLTAENHLELLTAAIGKSKLEVEELLVRHFPRPDVASSIRRLPPLASFASSVGGGAHVAALGTAAQRALTPSGALPATDGVPPRSLAATALGGTPATVSADALVASPATATIQAATSAADPSSPSATFAPRRPPVVAPLAPDRYQIKFTANARTFEKLQLARNLLRHSIPDGDTGEIISRALTALLEDLARKKFGGSERPRAGSEQRQGGSERPHAGSEQQQADSARRHGGGERQASSERRHSGGEKQASGERRHGGRSKSDTSRWVPVEVKRAVWLRDGARCAFVGSSGRRCGERGFLEFHHLKPFGAGGETTVANVQLRCRAHNQYEADLYYGPCRSREDVVQERRSAYAATRPRRGT
jgi:hypothetical protein